MPSGIEGECEAPLSVCRSEPKLLHVGVAGAFEGIDVRLTELGTVLFEGWEGPHDGCLDVPEEALELRLEFLCEFDAPVHGSRVG